VVVVRCNESGFDCDYTTTGNVEKIIFDYWDHINKEHGIEYSLGTLERYLKKKIPTQISDR
jgi:predicted small metal-binding protein